MKNLSRYKTPTTRDAYESGYARGHNVASWCDLPNLGSVVWTEADGTITVDEDNEWDVVQTLAYEAESNDRQYSPFQVTASEFNRARNSEARWDAFDAGIADGIAANIAKRQKAGL